MAKLHEEARRRGKANVVTYSAAISACAKEKRWKDALSLLAEMRREVSRSSFDWRTSCSFLGGARIVYVAACFFCVMETTK